MEYVTYLSREIGPRPAGTEEERRAAEFIAEELETSSGLPTEIEDFNAPAGNDAPRAICAGLAVVGGLFSLFLPMIGIPAVILCAIATVLVVLEYLDKPILQKLFSRGASQNVVAKYDPGMSTGGARGRVRKVVVVARYDSGKVRNELSGGLIKILPGLQKASFWSVPALFVAVLIRALFLSTDTGFLGIVFTVLVFVGVVLSLIPLVFTLLHKIAAYNEAANSNASGVAVMMEVAGRVGRGRMTEEEIEHLHQYDDLEADKSPNDFIPVIHGEEEALAAGVVPEGIDVVYDAEPTTEPVEDAEAEPEVASADGLLAAKAAIAALTGMSVPATVAPELFPSAAGAVETPVEDKAPVEEEDEPAPTFALETAQRSMPAVPDWFAAAQAKAKANKPLDPDATGTIKRSRYADALDAAVSESSAHFNSANRQALTGMDDQIARLNDGIVEVKAPGFEDEPVVETFAPAPVVETIAPAPVVEEEPASDRIAPSLPIDNVVEFEHGFADADIQMPSFLENDRFDVAETPAPVEEVAPVEAEPVVEPFVAPAPVVEEEPEEEAIEPVSDFVGLVTNDVEPVQSEDDPLSLSSRLPVVLADTTGSFAAIDEGQKQRAPLADSSSTAKSLLSMLPSINPSDPAQEAAAASARRLVLPSLSGAIPAVSSASAGTGSAGATGVFAPVTDDLVRAASPEEDLFIEDADDSEYQENFTDQGAFAGPDYIEMPKSPVRSFFDKLFHRKDKEEVVYDESQWVEEEDEYEDSWEDDQEYDEYEDEYYDDYDEYDDEYDDEYAEGDDKWNGGAFSALKDAAGSIGGKAAQAAQGVAGKVRGGSAASEDDEEPARTRSSRRGRFADLADEVPADIDEDPRARFEEAREALAEDVEIEEERVTRSERRQVETFRNPFVDSEVWFVALGSELAGNAGIRAFIDAHSDELRGAMIVELDALGAGKLCMVETEGTLKTATTSSRMKRYMRKVAQVTGISCGTAHFDWNDSATSYANTHGVKAMHLVGEMDGKPAYFAQDNDTVEAVEEDTLETNVECVMELLRQI